VAVRIDYAINISLIKQILCSLFPIEYTADSDKCEKLGEPPKKLKNQKRTKSIILPLIDLFDSFSEI
jgi:hypothetical protein